MGIMFSWLWRLGSQSQSKGCITFDSDDEQVPHSNVDESLEFSALVGNGGSVIAGAKTDINRYVSKE